MTRDELIEIMDDYERAGWIICALPPEVAPIIVGRPATQLKAIELMAVLRERERRLEALGG